MKHSKKINEQELPFGVESPAGSQLRNTAPFDVRAQKIDRKALQLCAQVRYALEYAINDVLKGEHGLTVLEVAPAPNTSHLLVFVQSLEELSFEENAALEFELTGHLGALRSAVSESIHRRKTPGLSFQVVPKLSATHSSSQAI